MQNITFLPIDYRAQFVMIYHIGRGNNAAPQNPKDCIMNKFCVGQKVIDCFNDRKLLTVVKTFESGQIELENGVITYTDRVQCQERYLDKTSFFYHHSKFGEAIEMMNDGFYAYRGSVEEYAYLESLVTIEHPSAFMLRALSMCQELIDNAAAKIEQGLTMKRTAEHNLAQWDGLTLDYHKPFLNPENLTNY